MMGLGRNSARDYSRVRHLACRAGALTLDTDGVLSLLEEARAVNGPHPDALIFLGRVLPASVRDARFLGG